MGESLLPAVQWAGGLLAIHLIFHRAAKRAGGEVGASPHLAGHFPVALMAFTVLAVIGTMKWLSLPPMDRLHGYSPDGVFIARFMLAFQLYELVAIALDWKLSGPGAIMVMHHCLVITLSAWVITHQYMQYYCIFFFGVPEISSVPLTLVDLFKQIPTLRARYPMLNEAARNSFAVTFLLIRNIWFPLVSFHFWKDSLNELKAPTSPQSKALVITVCAVNIVMVALQFHWGSLIVRAVLKMLKGDMSHKDA